MQLIMDGTSMKAADFYTQQHLIDGSILMDRAAHAIYSAACRMCSLEERILIVCGKGNNGGDGLVTAELLLRDHSQTEVFFDASIQSVSPSIAALYNRFRDIGGQFVSNDVDFSDYDLIIDALFGIGLSRPVEGRAAELIRRINASGARVLSIDMPSGIHTDNGQVMGIAVKADVTVTVEWLKPGLLLYPGAEYAGKIETAKIGIAHPPTVGCEQAEFHYSTLERTDIRTMLPERKRRSHKGLYGHILLAAGSLYMGGCAVLAAESAYRTGVGLVTCLTDQSNRDLLMLRIPEALYAQRGTLHTLKEMLAVRTYSAAAIGPGIGLSEEYQESKAMVEMLLTDYTVPLVLDADALTLLARESSLLDSLCRRSAPTILTPHMGEMSRLTGRTVKDILLEPVTCAASLARDTGAIVLLKDAATIVTDGKRVYLNKSGCDGMATGGSGDVLTGIIAGFCGQGISAFEAACLGAYLHGLAGEEAQHKKGERSMLARDILAALPDVLQQATADERKAENHG